MNTSDNVENISKLARHIATACGPGSVLCVGGCGEQLVQAMRSMGMDAQATDNMSSHGDASVDAVVVDIDEPNDAPSLEELVRVTKRDLVLRVAGDRAESEKRLFDAGFRKHARYYAVLPYEELEHEPAPITIVMEKLPAEAARKYPPEALVSERDLHMDMLRETGRRSDGHVSRYQMAARLVRPGDRVLDAACGLGYGAHVLRHNSMASSVIGIDLSQSAVEYARTNFAADDPYLQYRTGDLPGELAQIPEASIDFIASFETLEHLAEPQKLLAEFNRILTPGGRVVVSVPNQWTDETGQDPNPYHLQVYDWKRVREEVEKHFLIDAAWQQVASQQRIFGENRWEPGVRRFRRFDPRAEKQPDSEWWVVVGVKSPANAGKTPYRESIFANVSKVDAPVARFGDFYDNPWLVHAMVNIGYRIHDARALEETARQVMQSAGKESADFGAALCVLAYQAIQKGAEHGPDLYEQMQQYLQFGSKNPHVVRWQISLCFVLGRWCMARGEMREAIEYFSRCVEMDSLAFAPHLATKTAEAAYWAGRLNLSLHEPQKAREQWQRGLKFAERLLATPLNTILVNPDYPNLFDHGDGMREFTLALDFLTRCANGLHLLQRQAEGVVVDWRLLDGSFNHLAQALQADLSESQSKVAKLTGEVDEAREQLRDHLPRLQGAEQGLVDRTAELEAERAVVRQRTGELDQTRGELRERTKELDQAREDLRNRTRELDDARADLVSRTAELDQARADLEATMKELREVRAGKGR